MFLKKKTKRKRKGCDDEDLDLYDGPVNQNSNDNSNVNDFEEGEENDGEYEDESNSNYEEEEINYSEDDTNLVTFFNFPEEKKAKKRGGNDEIQLKEEDEAKNRLFFISEFDTILSKKNANELTLEEKQKLINMYPLIKDFIETGKFWQSPVRKLFPKYKNMDLDHFIENIDLKSYPNAQKYYDQCLKAKNNNIPWEMLRDPKRQEIENEYAKVNAKFNRDIALVNQLFFLGIDLRNLFAKVKGVNLYVNDRIIDSYALDNSFELNEQVVKRFQKEFENSAQKKEYEELAEDINAFLIKNYGTKVSRVFTKTKKDKNLLSEEDEYSLRKNNVKKNNKNEIPIYITNNDLN